MSLNRTPHWATRELTQYLADSATKPFAWGENDCCLAAANAIQAFTGTDIADDFRGKYTDEASAFALIISITGGSTIEDAAMHCAQKHGLPEYLTAGGKPAPLFAQRGDLVVMKNGDNLIAGVVHLNGRHLVTVGQDGMIRLPISTAVRAWKV